jgi:hypothetical protein
MVLIALCCRKQFHKFTVNKTISAQLNYCLTRRLRFALPLICGPARINIQEKIAYWRDEIEKRPHLSPGLAVAIVSDMPIIAALPGLDTPF